MVNSYHLGLGQLSMKGPLGDVVELVNLLGGVK